MIGVFLRCFCCTLYRYRIFMCVRERKRERKNERKNERRKESDCVLFRLCRNLRVFVFVFGWWLVGWFLFCLFVGVVSKTKDKRGVNQGR